MSEFQIILDFLQQHIFSFLLFIIALLFFSEKFFGTLSHLQKFFGFETRWSLEKKHQKEIIDRHTEMLDKLTTIMDNQSQDIQVIKDMMREQAQFLCNQKVSMEELFEHTAELAKKISVLTENIDNATVLDEALKDGLAALLRDRIKQAHRYYVEHEKEISATGLENVTEMFSVYYYKLHENGVGKKMYEEIKALPIKSDDTYI
ncbi:MAG: hypothetical protein ACLTBR_03590 [Anaerostipes sp.]|uniref:hypothetical protein n=1 Tax=Anaerostipes sp. TaxID=1872530 RepID=UPI0039919A78